MNKLMNDTKWDEIRLAMYSLECRPLWRTKNIETGYISSWDGEWFYHFSINGYKTIEWLEISYATATERNLVLAELKKIHVPGEEMEGKFRIYGYAKYGQFVDYVGTE